MKNHYVYRITNILLKKHYYGVRSTKIEPSEDLGIEYFSSSTDKEFIKDQKENPNNYKYKIIMLFTDRKKAMEMEIKLHAKFDVMFNESFYNLTNARSDGFGFGNHPSEETKAKISKTLKGKKPTYMEDEEKHKSAIEKMKESKTGVSTPQCGREWTDEERLEASERAMGNTNRRGKKHTEDAKRKMSESQKERERKPHTEKTKQKMSESALGRKQKIVECPHCGKFGGISLMKQWHFDKCKKKDCYVIQVIDRE